MSSPSITTKSPSGNSFEIDAAGVAVGRVATQAVRMLLGKNLAGYEPRKDVTAYVHIRNLGLLKFTGKKFVQKDFRHHTMFPGGIKRVPMKKVFENRPKQVMRHAISGMLPKNRRRSILLSRVKYSV